MMLLDLCSLVRLFVAPMAMGVVTMAVVVVDPLSRRMVVAVVVLAVFSAVYMVEVGGEDVGGGPSSLPHSFTPLLSCPFLTFPSIPLTISLPPCWSLGRVAHNPHLAPSVEFGVGGVFGIGVWRVVVGWSWYTFHILFSSFFISSSSISTPVGSSVEKHISSFAPSVGSAGGGHSRGCGGRG